MEQSNLKELNPWTRQPAHLAGLLFLVLNLYVLNERFGASQWWTLWAFLTAFAHQGLVAFVWRHALFHPPPVKSILRIRIAIFGALFFIFLGLRILSTFLTARAAKETIFPPLEASAIAFLVILGLGSWTIYSVFRYFGVFRALGADHFVPAYSRRPPVKEGAFRYTGNAMYTFGTLLVLLPGIWFRSGPGLAAGVFHYCAIWIHYWATELPDMGYIYGQDPRKKPK